MKVKKGDILVCGTDDCGVELTVTSECMSKGDTCEINATCCEEPMELKSEKGF